MRGDDLYLNDIVEAAGHIAAFLGESDFEDFRKSETSPQRISDELKARYPRIPWPQIVAFRNLLIHAYFGIDWNEVWKAAKVDCSALRGEVLSILETEFGGLAGDSRN